MANKPKTPLDTEGFTKPIPVPLKNKLTAGNEGMELATMKTVLTTRLKMDRYAQENRTREEAMKTKTKKRKLD